MTEFSEAIKAKRIERMRQGQNTAEIERIPSCPDMRVALVPLLEGEYDECLLATARAGDDIPQNVAGGVFLDRYERREVVRRAARTTDDYQKHAFDTVDQMMEVLEPEDINVLYASYVNMVSQISPSADALTEEEVNFLKEVFEKISWKDLSGKQVYGLIRFLSTLGEAQLMDKLPGRISTL